MRRCLIVIFIVLLFMPLQAHADEGYADDFRDSVTPEDSLLSDDTDLNDPSSVMNDLETQHVFSYLLRRFSAAFGTSVKTLIKGISMVLLSVIVNRCSGNIQNQNLQLLFSFIVSVSIVLMCQNTLQISAGALQNAIDDMGIFTTACIPYFSVVMVASGEGAGSAVFSSAMVLLGEFGSLISKQLLLPLVDVYLAIGVCSAVSDEYNFMVVGKQIRRFLIWSVGIIVMLFRLILKLQSGVAAAGDQVTQKYIRSAVSTMIPMIGGTLSQGVDGLFAIASGVRTSFAVAGILMVLSIMLPSLISAGVHGITWGICRWMAEFMNDSTMRSISDVLANSFYVMLALGSAVALMGLFSFFGLVAQVA